MEIPIQPVQVGGRTIRDSKALQTKIANVSQNRAGQEQTLAKLGLHALQDRVTALMPYFKGFQLLDVSEDGEFSSGFFVFQLTNTIVDAPMFLNKGQLKGKELLFLREKQTFIPSQDGLVQYLAGLQDQAVGEAGPDEKDQRSGRATPNIDVFSRGNRFLYKVSSYPRHFDQWARNAGVLESRVAMYRGNDNATAKLLTHLKKHASLPAPDLKSILPLPGVAEKLATWCAYSPKLAERVRKRLGDNWTDEVIGYREKTASFRKLPQSRLKPRRVKNKLSIKTAAKRIEGVSMREDLPKYLSSSVKAAARAEIAEFGAAFFDRRQASQVKKAYAVEFDDTQFNGPFATGEYKVPMRNGEAKKCFVILPRDRIQVDYSNYCDKTLVVCDGEAVLAYSDDLLVRSGNDMEPVENANVWPDGLPTTADVDIPEGQAFILVDRRGNATDPLMSKGSNEPGVLDVTCPNMESRGRPSKSQDNDTIHYTGSPYYMSPKMHNRISQVCITETSKDFQYVESEDSCKLMIPRGTKIIRLKMEPREDREPVEWRKVQPCDILPNSEMDCDTMRKIASISLFVETPEIVQLDNKRMPTKQAAFSLMNEKGLGKDEALQLLREVHASGGVKSFAVVPKTANLEPWQIFTEMGRKLAIDSMRPDDQPSYSFRFPQQGSGVSDSVIGVKEQYPVQTSERAPVEYADRDSEDWKGQDSPYEEPMESGDPMQNRMEAAALADSEESLWENKMFEALVRHARVDSQISHLVQALLNMADTAGRTLFLLYAHPDDFEETFGDKDIPQMEEQLLTLFEGVGDLVVEFLKRNVDSSNDALFLAGEMN